MLTLTSAGLSGQDFKPLQQQHRLIWPDAHLVKGHQQDAELTPVPLQAQPIDPVANLLQHGAAGPNHAAGEHRQEAPNALDVKPGFAARRHIQLSGKTQLMTGGFVEPETVLPCPPGTGG